MKKLLGRIFASSESGDAIIQGAVKGLDALVFTQEEKAQMSQETFKLWLDWQQATSGQNLARRYIALVVVALWAALILLGVTFLVLEQSLGWMGGTADAVFDVLGANVDSPLLLVLGFYFGKHLITSGIDSWKKKGQQGD